MAKERHMIKELKRLRNKEVVIKGDRPYGRRRVYQAGIKD
jgi:hypothetical protein